MSENQIPSEYLDVGKNSPEKRTSQPEETATEANEREVTAGDIQLKIYFGGHDTEEDADKLAKGLQEADVYIPEVNGWNDSALKFFSDVSKGEQSLDTIIKDAERSGAVIGPFRRRVSELLYATNKPIIIVDIPYGHQALSNAAEEINERTDDFSTAIEKTKQELKEEAANQLEREAHILTELQDQLPGLKANYPSLFSNPQIKVFMPIGAVHTRISHKLLKDEDTGIEVTRDFSEKPFLYLPYSEAIRRNMFNKEVSNDLVAKVLLLRMVDHKISQLTSDTDQLARLSKTITNGYSTEEVENLYNVFRNAKSWNEFDSFFASNLAQKGITLPQQQGHSA